MTLERTPEVQQIITALQLIVLTPARFDEEFRRQATVEAIDLLQIAYRPKHAPPPPQSPGQLDLSQMIGWVS